MRLILIFMEIVLIVADIVIFLKYRKVLLEHSKDGKLRISLINLLPYFISMIAVSVLVPVFAIIALMV